MIRRSVKAVWRRIAPTNYWVRQLAKMKRNSAEPEVRLLPALSAPGSVAVDVGAAGGVYIAHLLGRASKIFAFEPRPAQAALLRELTSVLRLPIQVEAVALSDRCGTATLRMLSKDLGRSTIDAANALEDPDGSPQTQISVPMRRLDAYELHQLGFMKIDVEGHELAVLDGAEKTIVRTRCNVLVETEDRHHAGDTLEALQLQLADANLGIGVADRPDQGQLGTAARVGLCAHRLDLVDHGLDLVLRGLGFHDDQHLLSSFLSMFRKSFTAPPHRKAGGAPSPNFGARLRDTS